LLIQRTHEPFRQQWNVPAGYVEIDENPAQAVVREVYEETGLQVEIDQLVNVYFFDDDPRGNGILIAYQCHIVGGEPAESAEGTSPTFFARDQIPEELAGGGHREAILAWQEHNGLG
jgi:8-oxo-dGTP diphosphatase